MKRLLLPALPKLCLAIAMCLVALSTAASQYKVSPIVLDEENAHRIEVGRLIWRGGFSITGTDNRFGGLSALHVTPDGQRMHAVTDRGNWVTATLTYQENDLSGMRNIEITPLLDVNGKPLKGRLRDAESLAIGNSLVISFERKHRLWRYTRRIGGYPGLPTPMKTPAGFYRLSDNGGIEAMTRLCDGRLLVLAEKKFDQRPGIVGWIQTSSDWFSFRYQTKATLRPTGSVTLPNCDIAVVERSFSVVSGLKIRVTRVRTAEIQPTKLISPEELAYLSYPLSVDNFEGIAARVSKNGKTLIYLVSDDNFNSEQRTLLVMFELNATP